MAAPTKVNSPSLSLMVEEVDMNLQVETLSLNIR